MNYILIIGIFQALFLILLLFNKKDKVKSDVYLGIIIALYALTILLAYIELHNIQNDFPFPQAINLNWLILFLHGPALWFYIKSLGNPKFTFKPFYILHFLPFIIFLVIHYIRFISLPEIEKITIVKNELFTDQVFYKISILSIGISTITYNLWALNLIKAYQRKLNDFFSKTDSFDLKWLRILTIASLSIYLVNVALFNLDMIFHIAPYKTLMIITYSFASVYVLIIGFFGVQQKSIFIGFPNKEHLLRNNKKYAHNDERGFIEKLQLFMNEEKPFLEPELNLLKLSKLLNVKTEYLSEILNSHMHQTFFDFINKYRIEEFKKQCIYEENKHFSIIGIAYNCGFNSKASFYRAFKKFEGVSPSLYIHSVS